MRPGRSEKGLTLIEALVGVIVVSILSLSLAATLGAGIRASGRGHIVAQRCWQSRVFIDILTKDLENLVLSRASGAEGNAARGGVHGNATGMEIFVLTASGTRRVRYYLEIPAQGEIRQTFIGRISSGNAPVTDRQVTQEKTAWLVREESPLFTDGLPGTKRQIVSRDVRANSLNIRYGLKNQNKTEDAIAWHKECGEGCVPQGIRFEATWMDPEGRFPDMPVAKDFLVPSRLFGKE